MDYSQFLHMREELSLVAVLLLLFLADLFMSPDAQQAKRDETRFEHHAASYPDGHPYSDQSGSKHSCRHFWRYVSLCTHAHGCQINP